MKKLLWPLLTFLLIILTTLTLLVTTESGLKFGLYGVNRFTGIKIEATKLKGAVIGGISAKKITINTGDIQLKITNLELRYNPFALLWKKIKIDYLSIGSMTGTLPEAKKNDIDSTSLTVEIKHANVGLMKIRLGKNSKLIRTKNIHWQGLINEKKINLFLTLESVTKLFKSAQFSIIGPTDNYKITALVVSKYTKFHLTGSGNLSSANMFLSSQSTNKTLISGTISLSWLTLFKWSGTIQLNHINTKPFLENGPLINTFHATSSGQLDKKLLSLTWQVNANTTSGIIETRGNYTPKSLTFDWAINNLAVQPFYSKSEGTISSKGLWDNGKTNGTLSLADLTWRDLSLNNFQAQWDGNVSTQEIHLLKINFDNLSSPELAIQSGKINIHRSVNNASPFDINLILVSQKTPIDSLAIKGELKKTTPGYTLSLRQFNLNALLQKWRLEKPTFLSILTPQKENGNVINWAQTPFCLMGETAFLCENSTSKGNTWQATLTTKNLPLHNFTQMINVNLPADIDAKFYKNENEPAQGEAIITLPKASIYFSEYGVETPIKLKNTKLNLKLLPNTLEVFSSSNWGKNDFFKIKGIFQRPADDNHPWKESKLNGSIQLSMKDLGFLNTLSDVYDIHTGSIHGKINAAGTVSAPALTGDINLVNSNIEIMMLENTIRNIHGKIHLNGQSANLKITGNTETAPIGITGKAGFQKNLSDFKASFALNGKNVQLADSKNYKAFADVDLSGDFVKDHLTLKGILNIPRGNIMPPAIRGSATTLPSDVIILGDENDSGMNASIDILIKLGKKVVVSSKEFYGHLTGELRILKEKSTEALGKGTLRIEDGRINALDLNLIISDDSTISFDNTPLDSPFINVKVFRKIKQGSFGASALSTNTELTVGISAIGVYGNLLVTLYSLPTSLGQSDILSYLILGHPLGSAGAFNLASMLATIGSMSSDNLGSGLNKLMSIKKTFGFSELGVQSSLSLDALGTPYGADESGFVVGRYLTPKIYVRYTSGISTELNLFQLQYFFNPKWSVQLQSGNVDSTNVEGIDGLYHFTNFFSDKKKQN